MKIPHQAAARVHVLLARNSPKAVVFRRGPSRHTAVIGWDRQTDKFKVGQWLYGRIYERRSDLSPDGRHLIYFAMNGRWESAVKGSWTAISRAPFLRALTLYAKGDCWHGGGLFQAKREYWLNDGQGHELQLDNARLRRSTTYPWHESYGGECPGIYFIRLQRDGWILASVVQDGTGDDIVVFEKRVNGHWTLRKLAHATVNHPIGRGVYFDTHQLYNTRTEQTITYESWEWAEVDGKRLVWAADGKLHAGRLGANGLTTISLLQDFNSMKFETLVAPDNDFA
jgi:hypothetical protein